MPAVAMKSATVKVAPAEKAVKKQSLKKTQKTETIKAAKKLAKVQAKKAVSEKVRRTRDSTNKRMRYIVILIFDYGSPIGSSIGLQLFSSKRISIVSIR